jgi:hypothetical protein
MKYIKAFESYNLEEDPRYTNFFAIGNLVIPTEADFEKIVAEADTVIQLYGDKAWSHIYQYLMELDEIYGGGSVYRVVITDDINNVDTSDLGKHWTVDKKHINDILLNVVGDYKHNFLDTELQIPVEEVKIALIKANTPEHNFDPKSCFGQFLEFPEEGEIFIKDPSKLVVRSIEEYPMPLNLIRK